MFEELKKSECCGCQACVLVCPRKCLTFKADEEGFGYPHFINSKECINCDLCNSVCPSKNKHKALSLFSKAFYGYLNSDEVLQKSSSGGAFRMIAQLFMAKGYRICGAVYDEEFKVRQGKYYYSGIKN